MLGEICYRVLQANVNKIRVRSMKPPQRLTWQYVEDVEYSARVATCFTSADFDGRAASAVFSARVTLALAAT